MPAAGTTRGMLAILVAATFISACAGDSEFRQPAFNVERAALWEDGLRAAASGEAMIVQGERLVADGRRQIREGEALIADGKLAAATAKDAYQEIAGSTGEGGPYTTKRRLERIDRDWDEAVALIERGRLMIDRGNRNIETGQQEIKEGQALMAQGGEKMRRSRRQTAQ